MRKVFKSPCLFVLSLLAGAPALYGQVDWKKIDEETFEHFTKLVQIDTSNPPGNETAVAKYLQGVLEKEGISCKLVGADPNRLSLIARLKGSGKRSSAYIRPYRRGGSAA